MGRGRTGLFKAQDDKGRSHTIYIYTDFIEAETFGHSEEVEGLHTLQLDTGELVNRLAQGEYQVRYRRDPEVELARRPLSRASGFRLARVQTTGAPAAERSSGNVLDAV